MSIWILAIAIFALSLAGGLAPRSFGGRLTDRQLGDFTGLASGLLLASAFLVVIPEGFHVAAEIVGDSHDSDGVAEIHDDHEDEEGEHHDDETGEAIDHEDDDHEDDVFAYGPAVLGATVLAGFAAMLLLEGLGVGHAVHEEHHDHVEGHGHGHVHHPTSMKTLAVGLSVHALADGLAIGSAAATGEAAFSFLVALAVVIHRVPAAFSLGLFAHHETDQRTATRAIGAFAIATPIAMILAYLLLDGASERLIALTLLFSAGTFVYVATVDTLPAIHNPETGRRSVMLVLLGAVVFAALFLGLEATGTLEHAH